MTCNWKELFSFIPIRNRKAILISMLPFRYPNVQMDSQEQETTKKGIFFCYLSYQSYVSKRLSTCTTLLKASY